MIPSTLKIDQQFCGPPNSGNGGYSCGLLGQFYDEPAEVMLRVPPPLEKNLTIDTRGDELFLMDDTGVVAQAKPTSFEVNLPDPISFKEAETASAKYIGFNGHHFHTCFVCGPSRKPQDALRIFAGATHQEGVVAAPWVPYDELFNESGQLEKIYYWAAMDCPSYFAMMKDKMEVLLLGKMAAQIVTPVYKGEKIVVMAWKIGVEGRKHYAGTVLYGEDGQVKSYCSNIWIALSKEQAEGMVVKEEN